MEACALSENNDRGGEGVKRVSAILRAAEVALEEGLEGASLALLQRATEKAEERGSMVSENLARALDLADQFLAPASSAS